MIHSERSAVQWGTTTIPYQIRRSPRRATVSLTIDPRAGLLVTAPTATPVPRLDAVVRTKARWITERLRRTSDLAAPLPKREFVSGETFSYLGRQLRLRLVDANGPAPIRLRAGWLELAIERRVARADRADRADYARAALIDWYRKQAKRRLPGIVTDWAQRAGVEVAGVVVTEQTRRWGSCDRAGVLRFNWRVLQAPVTLVEYVVAHEIVHLRHEHHGAEFWSALGRLMPDYEARKGRLKVLGGGLVW